MADKNVRDYFNSLPEKNSPVGGDMGLFLDSEESEGGFPTLKKAPRSAFKGDPGEDGAPGADGAPGTNSYTYIGYSSDSYGANFSLSPSDSLQYMAILVSEIEIPSPTAANFTGLWRKYIGDDGDPGEDGVPGADGEDGTDGKSVISGENPPTSLIGKDGDYYVDTKTYFLYGPKTSGTWPLSDILSWNYFIGTGITGIIRDIVSDSLGNIYIAGTISIVGNVLPVNKIAKFDGSTWTDMGGGIDCDAINCLEIDNNDNIYAGWYKAGPMTGGVKKWNGASWSDLGTLSGDGIFAVNHLEYNEITNSIFAGGSFTSPVVALGKYNLSTESWSQVANFGTSGNNVTAFKVLPAGDAVYVGGSWASADFMVSGIGYWNGSAWINIGYVYESGGAPLDIYDMDITDTGVLFICGNFTHIDFVAKPYIAYYIGGNWFALGTGVNDKVLALEVDNKTKNIILVGDFTTCNGSTYNRLAYYKEGTGFIQVNGTGGFDTRARAVHVRSSGATVIGGDFLSLSGNVTEKLVALDADLKYIEMRAHTLFNGAGAPSTDLGEVDDFYIDTTNWLIYGPKPTPASWGVGVSIKGADGADGADGRTILNGEGAPEDSLGENGDFYIDTLTTELYGPKTDDVWGYATGWEALGLAPDNWVNKIARDSVGNIYAVGRFTSIGSVTTEGVAKLDVSTGEWQAMGTGLHYSYIGDGEGEYLFIDSSDNVYVTGKFTDAGGVSNTGLVAMWNGTSWEAVGTGLGVNTTLGRGAVITKVGDALFVGGRDIELANETPVDGIAMYKDGAWSVVSFVGAVGTVFVTAFEEDSEGNLLIATSYSRIGVNFKGILKYDPETDTLTEFTTLADGTVSAIYCEELTGDIYIGGGFDSVQGIAAKRIARYVKAASTWEAIGAGFSSGSVIKITKDTDGKIIVAGAIWDIAGSGKNCMAKWTGSAWVPYGGGSNLAVTDLIIKDDNTAVAAGQFSTIGGVTISYIANSILPLRPPIELIGDKGDDGADGASSFTYIGYASDDSGTDFSLTPIASSTYIAVLNTDTEIPSPVVGDFAGLWNKYVGADGVIGSDGADGADGTDGESAYVYIAYASDDSGTDFTNVFDADLSYIAILSTEEEIVYPEASDFTGLWKYYGGADPSSLPEGLFTCDMEPSYGISLSVAGEEEIIPLTDQITNSLSLLYDKIVLDSELSFYYKCWIDINGSFVPDKACVLVVSLYQDDALIRERFITIVEISPGVFIPDLVVLDYELVGLAAESSIHLTVSASEDNVEVCPQEFNVRCKFERYVPDAPVVEDGMIAPDGSVMIASDGSIMVAP